eukprot:5209234-Prymnesium_polylepis.1
MRINSPEHTLVSARLDELVLTELGAASDALQSARASSKATQLLAILCKASGAGITAGFFRHYSEFLGLGGSRTAEKLGASRDAANA